MIAFIFFSSLSTVAFLVGLLGEAPAEYVAVLTVVLLDGSGLWISLYAIQRENARNGRDPIIRSDGRFSPVKSTISERYHPLQKVVLLLIFYFVVGATVLLIVYPGLL